MRRTKFAVIGSLALLTTISARAAAQATPTVAPDERVYRDIDRLSAAGLIDTIIIGTRPYSRREIVRLLQEAQRSLGRNARTGAWAADAIAHDLALYADHSNQWLDEARADVVALSSPPHGNHTDGNGFLNAEINPLAANREGRPYVADGVSGTLETYHSWSVAPWLAVAANPLLAIPNGPRLVGARDPLTLQTGSVDALFGNLSIEVGRDYTIFGQSPTGGLLLSENAPSLDLVRISNDRPAALPWFLRHLGPTKGMLTVGDMGATAFHPHARLIAYHLSALPSPSFEIGFEVTDIMGGGGSPHYSLGQKLVDASAIIDPILRRHTTFLSNKFFGGDFRWRIPGVTGLELYGENALDDFDDRRLKSSSLEDGGYIVGIHDACLVECGRYGVRAEYRQTGIRYYTHSDYDQESNGWLLGDPLGPRGLGGYLTLDGDANRAGELSVTGAFEVRSGNLYKSVSTTSNDRDFHFVQLAHRPAEKRSRLTATWFPGQRDRHVMLGLTAGLERVTDFNFVAGGDRTNALGQLRFEYRP